MSRADNTQEGAVGEVRGVEDAVAEAVVISTGMPMVMKEAVAVSTVTAIKNVSKTNVGARMATTTAARLKKMNSK